MAGKSDYLENKVLEHSLGKTTFTRPANVYLALFTAAPTDAGGGTEVSGGGYARKQVAAADWDVASAGSITNVNALAFPTATGSWGTVTHFAIFDASTAGNMLWWGALGTPRTPNTGDTPSFAAGSIIVTDD